jgi:hypothetical protein
MNSESRHPSYRIAHLPTYSGGIERRSPADLDWQGFTVVMGETYVIGSQCREV